MRALRRQDKDMHVPCQADTLGDTLRAALTLARFVLLEARRTGLPWLAIGAVAAGIGMAGFLSQLALTESLALQAGVLAAFFRACVVFLTSILVATSVVRESGDKGTELLLSLPISRTAYYLGKLAGFSACGALLAGCFALVMLIWSEGAAVLAWFVSLVVEAGLIAAISLFFVMSLGQLVPALAATAGLYLLARTIAAIQSISAGPLADDRSILQALAGWAVDALALLLPPLDTATQTVWLLYGAPPLLDLLRVIGALLLYAALVIAAGLVDFHRRNL